MNAGQGPKSFDIFLPAAGIIVFLSVLAFRAYLISSGRAAPDADECVVGLMAMHVAQGKGCPLYFYGQNYGAGAGLEALLLSVLYGLVANKSEAVKYLGLFIWSLAAIVTFGAARASMGRRAGWLALALFCSAPQMALWSMKLRGGHITSLAFLMAAFWVLFSSFGQSRSRPRDWLLPAGGGALAACSALLQPITLAASLALILTSIYVYKKNKMTVQTIVICSVSLSTLLIFFLIGRGQAASLLGPAFDPGQGFLPDFSRLISTAAGIFAPHQDFGLLSQPRPGGIRSAAFWVSSITWFFFFSFTLVLQARESIISFKNREKEKTGNKNDAEYHAFPTMFFIMFAMIGTLVFLILAAPKWMVPRHLLAFYPLSTLLMAGQISAIMERRKSAAIGLAAVLSVTGLLPGLAEYGNEKVYNPRDPEGVYIDSLQAAIKSLREHGVSHVFSADAEFKWNLMMASEETIIARSQNPDDRYPEYVARVNGAVTSKEPAAVVVSNPETAGRLILLDHLLKYGGSEVDGVGPDVVIVYGLDGEALFRFFPYKISPEPH